ncbi:tetratricopeptide repeat protein [Entomospira culicis]|uniref:Tetratricopeptide repeat protein n=1 Tax=Entomospira culicis TaxID=2719989 RepID=A0A968KV40_9SPIO|nr:hypothetical protein [Entomospira culicis]NIZ19325.1 hypothetical protein [Entomospira culicis]NIZ69770.1 hypothetical protein [Entomospira culicis]WDI36881.1 hypothetical protein PVA46_06020 [Entomospira culicis]WDI38510.1 hypothetical protein PVA47_06030 [Entomospira culicis]
MDAQAILKKAERQLKATQYRQVIRLLEPKILLFNNDAHFYYLLGSACYFTNDINGAQLYLQRGLTSAEDNIDIRLLLACVALRKRDTAQALQLWLEVDDLEPDNKKARFGINKMKSIKDNRDLGRFLVQHSFKKLLPIKPISPLMRVVSSIGYTLTIMLLLVSIGFLSQRIFYQIFPPQPFTRDGVSEQFTFFSIKPTEILSPSDAPTLFILSEAQILQGMEDAREYFNNFQDDLAGRELNRVLLSNASSAVKAQAMILQQAFQPPTFATYNANFTFVDVASQPQLYNGLHVLWRGPINGLNVTPSRIAFRLLVGYEDGRVLEGAVDVFVPFEISLTPNLVTHVLGKVVANDAGNFYLEAVSINQIVALDSHF